MTNTTNPCRCCGKDLGWISPARLANHEGLFIHATCIPHMSDSTSAIPWNMGAKEFWEQAHAAEMRKRYVEER